MNMKKYICECIGTAVLVLFGCGTAVVSGGDLVATALAFGLSIIAMAYVIGNVSGCHINPAVSLGCLIAKRMSGKDFVGYVVAQIIGGFVGAGLLYFIVNSLIEGGSTVVKQMALGTNGFGDVGMIAAFVIELVLTFVFIYTILGVTADKEKAGVAGIVIGSTLTFVHLIGINLTGTSVNPARSLAPAVIMGGEALSQVWVFLLAPLCGAVIAAIVYKFLNEGK